MPKLVHNKWWPTLKLESTIQYLENLLEVSEHPDYSTALNGLQVQGPAEIKKICAAVDVSEEVIAGATAAGADLLVVHHGLFWSGLQPLTGRRFRKVRALIEARMGLYSCHLPLDAHPEFGNCALLASAIDVEPEERFGSYKGFPLGWAGSFEGTRSELVTRLSDAVEGPVQVIPGGPTAIDRVGVITGSGASFMEEAVAQGITTLVTGEGSHHTYVDAIELGMNVLYAGHYRTEVFGVKALCEHLAENFDVTWEFLDFPSGL